MLSLGHKWAAKALLGGFGALALLVLPAAVAAPEDAAEPSQAELWTRWNVTHGDPYELDHVERWLKDGQRFKCDQTQLVSYSGTTIRYAGAVLVSPVFEERLERFEVVAAEVAREIYGREPRRLKHYGAYN